VVVKLTPGQNCKPHHDVTTPRHEYASSRFHAHIDTPSTAFSVSTPHFIVKSLYHLCFISISFHQLFSVFDRTARCSCRAVSPLHPIPRFYSIACRQYLASSQKRVAVLCDLLCVLLAVCGVEVDFSLGHSLVCTALCI
jgi:hypothetical protein